MAPRFIYRGNAVGTAGHVTKPEDVILWVQGASSLPIIGGYSRSVVDRVSYPKYLTAESVKTESNGAFSESEAAFRSIANASARNVAVADRLTVGTVEATLISKHPVDGSQPSIAPTGTSISNMRLDGYPVNVTLDLEFFTKYSTLDSLSQAYTNDDGFFKRYGSRFQSQGKLASTVKGKRQLPMVSGYVMCSIVEKIQTDHPKATVSGHVLTLPGYGIIYLGELLITSVSRRLTLLRAQLGSPITAEMACLEVEENGIIVGV